MGSNRQQVNGTYYQLVGFRIFTIEVETRLITPGSLLEYCRSAGMYSSPGVLPYRCCT